MKPLLLISDIDDTLKRTHRLSKTGMLKKGLRSRNAFVGMPELYTSFLLDAMEEGERRKISKKWRCIYPPETRTVAYITGAISKFQWFSSLFLIRSHFPIGLYLGREEGSQFEFKTRAIERLIRDFPNYEIILIGDNGEADPSVFSTVKALGLKNPLHIFIHSVYPLPVPKGMTSFVTSVGLAAHFLNREWISEQSFCEVLDAVKQNLKEDPQKVMPGWVNPPEKLLAQSSLWPELESRVAKNTRNDYQLIRRFLQRRINRG